MKNKVGRQKDKRDGHVNGARMMAASFEQSICSTWNGNYNLSPLTRIMTDQKCLLDVYSKDECTVVVVRSGMKRINKSIL